MSKEQSPPVRKVIPYKSGRRRSPFADLALQFSGTALDVAIQQREEESEAANSPVDDEPVGETPKSQEDPLTVKAEQKVEEIPHFSEISPSQKAQTDYVRAVNADDVTSSLDIHLVNSKKSPSRPAAAGRKISPRPITDSSFQTFLDRWRPGLHRGQLKMCEVLYNKTHAVGRTDCETSFSVLMRESGLSRRQSFKVISELEQMGFVERLTTPKHSTRKGTGSRIRFHLTPKN